MLKVTNIALKTGAVTASTLLSYGLFVALQHITSPTIQVKTKDGYLSFEELLALVPELIIQSKNLTDLLQTMSDNMAVEAPGISLVDLMDPDRVPKDPETLMRVRQRQAMAPRREARSVSLLDDGFGELVWRTSTPPPTTAPPRLDISPAKIPDLRLNVGGGLAAPGLPSIPALGTAGGSGTSSHGEPGGDEPVPTQTDPEVEQPDDKTVDELFDFGMDNGTANGEDFDVSVGHGNITQKMDDGHGNITQRMDDGNLLELHEAPDHSTGSGHQEASDSSFDEGSVGDDEDDNGDDYVGTKADEPYEEDGDHEVEIEEEVGREAEVKDDDDYEDVVEEDIANSKKVEESAQGVDDALGTQLVLGLEVGRQPQVAAGDPPRTASGSGRYPVSVGRDLAFNFSVLKGIENLEPPLWNLMNEHGLFNPELNLTLAERLELAAQVYRRGRRDADKRLSLSSGDTATAAAATAAAQKDMKNLTIAGQDQSDNLASIILKSRELREQLQKVYNDLQQKQNRSTTTNPVHTSGLEVSTWVILGMALVIAILTTSFGCISYCNRMCKRCMRTENRTPNTFQMGPVMGPPIVEQPRANPAPVYASIQERQLPAPPTEAEERLRRLESLLQSPPAYQVAVAAAQPTAGLPAVMGAANIGPTLNVHHRHMVQAGEALSGRGATGHAALDGTSV